MFSVSSEVRLVRVAFGIRYVRHAKNEIMFKKCAKSSLSVRFLRVFQCDTIVTLEWSIIRGAR